MAGQAIEDALFLSWLFAHPAVEKKNIKEALEVFDAVRRPRANRVLESSLEAGDVYEMAGHRKLDQEERKKELETRFNWIWDVSTTKTRRCRSD
jgi:salicylate hydroxylase